MVLQQIAVLTLLSEQQSGCSCLEMEVLITPRSSRRGTVLSPHSAHAVIDADETSSGPSRAAHSPVSGFVRQETLGRSKALALRGLLG
jgi:hypothetical protein